MVLRGLKTIIWVSDQVLRYRTHKKEEIFKWCEVKTKTKRVGIRKLGYFKWWVMTDDWWVIKKKKKKSKQGLSLHLTSSLTLSKQLEQSRTLFLSYPQVQHQMKEKLSQALYLSYFRVQLLGKGNPFMQEWFYSYLPLKN